MATDNVVRFPEANRDSIGGRDRSRTLRESRDLVAQKLREAVRGLIAELQEELAAKGDVADEREQRNFYYGGRELLGDNVGRLEALFAGHWLQLFDAAIGSGGVKQTGEPEPSLDQLELVDLGDMDEQIAVKGLASALQDGCEEGLFAAGRRLAHLAGKDATALPLETLLAETAQSALKESGLPGPLRVEVLSYLERRGVEVLGPVIHDLNTFLVGRRILPTIRRSYARASQEKADATTGSKTGGGDAGDVFALLQRLVPTPAAGAAMPVGSASATPCEAMSGGMPTGPMVPMAGTAPMAPVAMPQEAVAAAMQRAMGSLDTLQHAPPPVAALPTANILREFRSSEVGQGLSHLDAVTVDIVATLFDFIFDDKAISDPIKALIGRLQIPLLKVAMLDKSFFSNKLHPARRLLDSISRAAVRCGPKVGHSDPLYAQISSIIERLKTEFKRDVCLFDALCDKLNDFLERQEREADAQALKTAPQIAERERRELAVAAADAALAAWLTSPLPVAVADILSNEWRALLVRHHMRRDMAAWKSAIVTAADLVASVEPITDATGRKMLAGQLPTLVGRIHDGLDQSGVASERRVYLLDCLFRLHATVLRGIAPPTVVAWAQSETPFAEPATVAGIASDDAAPAPISLVDSANASVREDDSDAQRRVDELQRGDWVEFLTGDSSAVRFRLSWISPARGILLFTNPHSPRAMSVTPGALAHQIERGKAAIVPVEPIFERAVNRALKTLKAS
jgi:hypothetical protein